MYCALGLPADANIVAPGGCSAEKKAHRGYIHGAEVRQLAEPGGPLMARPATGQVVVYEGKRGRTFALRFPAYGQRHFYTLRGVTSQQEAEVELQNVLADVRRGTWRPPAPPPVVEAAEEPTFH